jgi:translin
MALEAAVALAVAQIELVHQARERALTNARALTRQCANTIRAAHRADFAAAEPMLLEAACLATELQHGLQDHPELLFAGYTQDALKEYAEAALVLAFLQAHPAPTAAQLHLAPAAYLNGLAEAASELRRAILDDLRSGRTDRTEQLLSIVDDVYSLLITIDYPDAVTGGLRRTTDALRAVLERTRGDVTAAFRQDVLVAELRRIEAQMRRE